MMKATVQPDPRDYEIRIRYSAEPGDDCFVAQVVEWPGIMAHGGTREEAARQIQLALEGALEVAAEQGIKPPSPALAHVS
ncbi:MAG: type II toxin-antitoxin system HicB family antitoxin [Chthoniobacterales bacterium]